MAIFLDRIDAAPILEDDFSFAFRAWCGVLVDSINEVINDVQNALNLLQAPQYTTTQINAMFSAGDLVDGVFLYDNVLNVYVGQISGALVKFTTTSYP
jgi:hypothetical protein